MWVYFLYRIGHRLALLLPVKISYSLSVFFARMKFFLVWKERRYIANNLKVILGEDSPVVPAYARAMYENFGCYLVDFFRTERIDKEYIKRFIRITGLENMDEVLKKGKGAIGLTAHIGNWELCAHVLGVLGYRINAVALTHKNERINNFFINQRKLGGIKVVPVGVSVRKCFSALKNNEIVGILGDRDFSGTNGIFVDFLGRKMLVPEGPAVLSLRTKAAIVPAFMIRDEKDSRCFTYIFEKPVYPQPTGNEEQDILVLTEKIAKIIESYVRKYPQQWFMFREFWIPEKAEVT